MSGTTDIELPDGLHIEGEAPEAAQPRERPLSPREEIMAAAVRKAHQRMERDLDLGEEYHATAQAAGLTFPEEESEPTQALQPDEPPAAPPPAVATVPVASPPVQHAEPQRPEPVPHHDELRTIVIDGQQVRVTDEQYANLAQLGMIANIALHQAPQAPSPPTPTPQPPRQLVDDDQAREFIRAVQFSDVDAALPAVRSLIEGVFARAPQAPAPQQIDPVAIQRAATEAAIAQMGAAQKFAEEQRIIREEFPEIFANPQRTKLAAINVNELRANYQRLGVPRTDLDIYREAGFAVRDALGEPRPGSDVAPTPPAPQAAPTIAPRGDVIERKRAAPRNTQAVDRRAAPAEAARAPTGSEIVDRMRQQRGQQSLR